MKQLATILGIWMLLCGTATAQSLAPKTLDLCDLVTRWEQYTGSIVRIKASLMEGAEQSALYDNACRNGEPLVFVSPAAKVQGNKRKLRRTLAKNGRANVTIEGSFHGPEFAPIDPRLPQPLQDKLKGLRQTYGHLNSFQFMIDLTKIIDSSSVE